MSIRLGILETRTHKYTVELIKWSPERKSWLVRYENGGQQWIKEEMIKEWKSQ